jgi:putative ubiquitin-RnfH superfamily antitoxin RatB of RatAB toxin-antitoxin module
MVSNENFLVEIAYAAQTEQKIVTVEVEQGTTIEWAIERSGILEIFPEIDLFKQKVGVFSKARSLNDLVKAGDRIEIYRPLTIDPKEARRRRVKKK